MRVDRDKKYFELWRELVAALIDGGWIQQAEVERVATARRLHRSTVMGVFHALDLVAFTHDGENYWRLSDKVVPILPRRTFPIQSAARA